MPRRTINERYVQELLTRVIYRAYLVSTDTYCKFKNVKSRETTSRTIIRNDDPDQTKGIFYRSTDGVQWSTPFAQFVCQNPRPLMPHLFLVEMRNRCSPNVSYIFTKKETTAIWREILRKESSSRWNRWVAKCGLPLWLTRIS